MLAASLTWEEAAHKLGSVMTHGVRDQDDLVLEWLLAECLVRDGGGGGPVLQRPPGGRPGHEVSFEVNLALIKTHYLRLGQSPEIRKFLIFHHIWGVMAEVVMQYFWGTTCTFSDNVTKYDDF